MKRLGTTGYDNGTLLDDDFLLGTWNVRTMLEAGKMQEIASELNKYRMDLVALQEIRWSDHGEIRKPEYSILFSGSEKGGHKGVGFYLSPRIRKSLIGFEPVSDRICILTLKGRYRNITVVSIYAPTNEATDEEKDLFYSDLTVICNKISKYNMTILLGDFNAQIGKEFFVQEVGGQHSLHDVTNDNGLKLCELAANLNLKIQSTCFEHKNIHKETWKIPGTDRANQIDHALVSRRHSSSIIDVRSLRGANCDSDHYLVKAILRQRLSTIYLGGIKKRKKWNTDALYSDPVKKEAFITEVSNKLNDLKDSTDGAKWSQIQNSVTNACELTIGEKSQSKNSEWFDQDCQQKVELKRAAFLDWQQKKTRSAKHMYDKRRQETKKYLRQKRREALNKKLDAIDENFGAGNSKAFYKSVKNVTTRFTPRSNVCYDKNGETISDESLVLKRWAEYFEVLLNNPNHQVQEEFVTIEPINEAEQPDIEEIDLAIGKLKNGKSGGTDDLTAELFKNGGDTLKNEILDVIIDIWKNETLPKDWETGIIFPIHKKGDKRDCNNYRGITLLNVGYKIFTNVLFNRLQPLAESSLGDYQCGFRKNRSTTDQIFNLKIIAEKFYEQQVDLHCLFIDFKQAFDSINRIRIRQALQAIGASPKVTNLVLLTLRKTNAKIFLNGRYSDEFQIKSGIRQGDALSTLIFNIIMQEVIKSVEPEGTILTKSVQICADDITIIARSGTSLKECFIKIEKVANNFGLRINEEKTKYMSCLHGNRPPLSGLIIGEYNFETVQHFKYLGAHLSFLETGAAINERICAANKCMFSYKKLLSSRSVSRRSKIQIYKTIVRPVLTYGCESWTLRQADENKLQRCEWKILRSIGGGVRDSEGNYRRRYNFELDTLIEGHTVTRFVKAQRLRWLGHVMRMDVSRGPKLLLNGVVQGKRKKGRPRRRWMDCVQDDLRELQVDNWQAKAANRPEWKRVVEEAKVHRGL